MFSQHKLLLVASLALLSQATARAQSSKLDASTTCNETCKDLVLRVSSWEASQRASDGSFYTVPNNFSPSLSPGSILSLERTANLTNYTVPTPLTMSRMLYTTEDINGTIIPASAYILWPSSPLEVPVTDFSSNSTQWPMVAWAHGTSGGLQACAPSNYRNLQYHFQVPFTLALQGYVVVAPDYAGLGVGELPDGEVVGHPWAAFPAQANDIAHAITAARSAFPDYLKTDGPFVAMGHSQGGSAVWSFAERQVSKPIRGYRGAVAFAPPTDIINQARRARNYHAASVTKLWTNAFLSFQPPIIKGVTVAYPDMNLSGLTDVGRDRWVNVQEAVQGCLPTKQVSSFGVPLAETAHRNWTEHPSVLEFERRTAVGRRPFKGPLLILSGDVDSITDIENLRDVVRDTCRMEIIGNQTGLEFLEYKGQNHFPVIQASQGRWLAWINERFSSPTAKNTVSGCKLGTVKGFMGERAVNSVFPNFLLEVAGAGDGWKYSL